MINSESTKLDVSVLTMNFQLDHNSSVPLQAQVEEMLRKLIAMPEYLEGKLLPKEVELAKSIGISRTTLRLVIEKLVYEGRLVRRRKLGTKVANPRTEIKTKNWLSSYEELTARGITIRIFDADIAWTLADQKLSEFFAIDLGEKVLKLEMLYGDIDRPLVYSVSFFHPRIGLNDNVDLGEPIYDYLARAHSVVAKLSREEITAQISDKLVASKLDLESGTPILLRKRYVFDQTRRPIEYNLEYHGSDSFVYTVEIAR